MRFKGTLFIVFFFGMTLCIAQSEQTLYTYLALGDSYTKGEGVCERCGFPELLKTKIEEKQQQEISLKQIARTGWTTSDLLNQLEFTDLDANYDLVTLLIGVNNQYQGRSFSKFKTEFPIILDKAIAAANNNAQRVIVLSIPDYAYTPSTYGASDQIKVTREIDKYNEWIKWVALKKGAHYFNVTDLTRLGIADPTLVAKDGLHISEKAHGRVVDMIYQTVQKILLD